MIDIIGEWIAYLREQQGISREILCRGLCTRDQLRRIETKGQEAEKLLVDALMQRLGKTMEQFDLMLEDEEYDLLLCRVRIQQKLRQAARETDALQRVAQEIEEYEKKAGTGTKLQQQFLCLQKAELLRRQGAVWEQQWNMVCQGLRLTMPKQLWRTESEQPIERLRLQEVRCGYLSMLELLLLERYAILLETVPQDRAGGLQHNRRQEEALCWYEYLQEYASQERQEKTDARVHLSFVSYRMAGYYAKKRSAFALELLEKALELLRISQNRSPLFAKCMELKFEILGQQSLTEEERKEMECEKHRFEIFCTIQGEQSGRWQENWYPLYEERNAHSTSELIRERRVLLGLTQEQLAENICDVTTISRLERGKRTPQTWTKEMLLTKLGVSKLKYDGGIVTEDYTDYARAVELETLYYEQSYEAAHKLLEDIAKRMDMSYVSNQQFVEYWSIQLAYAAGKLSEEEQGKQLKLLLERSLGGPERYMKYPHMLIGNERQIFENLVWNNQTEKKEELYHILRGYYERMTGTEQEILFSGFYTTLLYCLGNKAWITDRDDEAMRYSEEMQEKLCYLQNERHLGALLFLKAWICKGLGEIEKSKEVLRQAYVVEKLYRKDKIALSYIESQVQEHYPGLLDDL